LSTLKTKIEFLKGVGPQKAQLLKTELSIHFLGDLLMHFPFRYVDKTKFHLVKDIGPQSDGETVQLKGILRRMENLGDGRAKRLVGRFRDDTGMIELVWFKGARWLQNSLQVGSEYIVYGRVNNFRGKISIPHPEIELLATSNIKDALTLAPVYPSTDKLTNKGLDAKGQRKLMAILMNKITPEDVPEIIPDYILEKLKLPDRYTSLKDIHFPKNQIDLKNATNRLKFEELFFLQLRLLQLRQHRKSDLIGYQFSKIGDKFLRFYKEKIPFELTGAQKRVIKEIRKDLGTARQMNRLLQGDVGSGKTMVGLMSMLMALDNGFQACMLAPTEILAQQHYVSIGEYVEGLDIEVGFLSGSIKGKKRKVLFERLEAGEIDILIGTHAILEDPVVFKNLGLAITDEQHRFGVKQRSKLWKKNKPYPPHILVMTATPIPRTLAMTIYGDLDVSVIDELPPGRKEIKTIHKYESGRLRVHGFIKQEVAKGRQVYIVYPLIEESETLDLQNITEGYESLSRAFPKPAYQISVVHGRMKPADKEFEMQRFVKGETQIMIATTVIEVGVNVPNASVMIVENTERFGLSQLHQLRGRVGRGAEQSFCILMTGERLSKIGKERVQTMCATNNGFEIADADLRLRGPGSIEGTQQSGTLNFRLVDLVQDGKILARARKLAQEILEEDLYFDKSAHLCIKAYMEHYGKKIKGWSRIG
jgi:ATP-dependent DNA helicase RecG